MSSLFDHTVISSSTPRLLPILSLVTLFDSSFLPQGLALYSSLVNTQVNFCLYVLCIDSYTYDYLLDRDDPYLVPISLDQILTSSLRIARANRNSREFAWTLAPFSVTAVFEYFPHVEILFYLDADTYLLSSLDSLYSQFATSKSVVAITPHYYSPQYDESLTSGDICVQLVGFKKSGGAQLANRWLDLCLHSCSETPSDGLFGDQMHLCHMYTENPSLFLRLSDQFLFLAPWNSLSYPVSQSLAFHFQGLRILSPYLFILGHKAISSSAMRSVYKPYLLELSRTSRLLPSLKSQYRLVTPTHAAKLFMSLFAWSFCPKGRYPDKRPLFRVAFVFGSRVFIS